MSPQPSRALAVPFLGVLASLQLIDPTVANTALMKAAQSLEMQGATLTLAASISTLAQAATSVIIKQLLRQEPMKRVLETSRLEQLGRFLLRGLRIGASTVSIVELLRSDWTGGVTAGVAWLMFLQVERRLPPSPVDPPSQPGDRS